MIKLEKCQKKNISLQIKGVTLTCDKIIEGVSCFNLKYNIYIC